jgi:predicted metal-dependent peptidase
MAKNKGTSTDHNETPKNDPFWGQPHVEGERFSDKEFEGDFLRLFMDEPFLGGISISISKKPDPNISTACVGFTGEHSHLTMKYNPYFFRSMTADERRGVIVHELYHLALLHLFERNITDHNYARLWNVATDLAINSIILSDPKSKLPSFTLLPGREPNSKNEQLKEFVKTAPQLQASEWYFEKMKEILDEQDGDGDGEGFDLDTLDDHDGWGEVPDSMKDELRDRAREIIREGVRRAQMNNSWGTVPQSIKEEICRGLENEVDWRSVIRMFFGSVRSMERHSTIKRVSRKIPGIIPGVKRGRTARFAFFIDQSGSMSDDDVAAAFAEVEGASKETTIDVYNFDTEIDEESHKVWQRGKKFPWGRTRCGGTDFNAVANFVNEDRNRNRWSGVVILTDGYAPEMGSVRGSKVLWIITETGSVEAARPGDLLVQLRKDKNLRSV